MMELVSVVIPTYARNDMLKRAINSVLNQTYSNFEIIVVDDNQEKSNYRKVTESLMEEYKNDDRIKYIKNEKNLGGAGARNVGITFSSGRYIAFLDDDDEYLPTKLEKQVLCFEKNKSEKLALVYGFTECISKDRSSIINTRFKGRCIKELLETSCIAGTSQWMCRRDILLKVGMFSVVPAKQDSTLMLKLFQYGYEIDCVEEVLSKYYIHEGERISNPKKTVEGEYLFRIYGRSMYNYLTAEEIFSVEYSFSKRMMKLYMKIGEKKKAIQELKIMVRLHPVNTIWEIILASTHVIKKKVIG